MILDVGILYTPTVCNFPPPYRAAIWEIDTFRPMALLELSYDIRGRAALDADNVPLDCLPIARLFEKYINFCLYVSGFAIRY